MKHLLKKTLSKKLKAGFRIKGNLVMVPRIMKIITASNLPAAW
jgi:hypothetical protein